MFEWVQPGFSPEAGVLVALILLVMAVALAVPRLRRRMLGDNPRTRAKRYLSIVRQHLVMIVVVAEALWLSPRLDAASFGVAWPSLADHGVTIAVAAALMLATAVVGVRQRRAVQAGQRDYRTAASADLVPRTGRERWLALAVSVSAGVAEELFFRGMLIAAGIGLLKLAPALAALVAIVLFSLAHVRFGWRGVVGAGWFGLLATALYALSGSLLLPVLLHINQDVTALLIVPPAPRPAGPPPAPAAAPGESAQPGDAAAAAQAGEPASVGDAPTAST